MRVCAVQMNPFWEDKKRNMLLCRSFAEKAGECDLLVFPEMTLTGFSMNTSLAEPLDGETTRFFCDISVQTGAAVAFGAAIRENNSVFNRLLVADSGRITARYDKVHPFSYGSEDKFFRCGDKAVKADIRGMTVGLSICYDLRFPELYRMLADDCSCIINIANWPQARSTHWQALLKARAIENQCFIIGCNRVGEGGGLSYSGDSAVYSPDGECIAACEPCSEGIVSCAVSADEVIAARKDFPALRDRKNRLYAEFYRS